jgi:hypothetical protein
MDLDASFKNNHIPRNGNCFTLRKARKFHQNLSYLHPSDSIEIKDQKHPELVDIFNRCEYFYCYDPYTYLAFMAAACGCIPIVLPLEGMDKQTWLKTLFCGIYMSEKGLTDMDGIAYGTEDIGFAKETIDNARKQQDDIVAFGFETVKRFCQDMETVADSSSIYWNIENTYFKK